MILKVVFLMVGISLINSAQVQFNTTAHGFPKVIWSYWDQGIQSAPFFVKLCLANKDSTANANGWKHIALSKESLHNYLDPEEVERYYQMIDIRVRSMPMKADVIRLLLMIKYGGLWMDASSYFLTDLQWTENPNKTLIHNKFSTSPDIILGGFTFTEHGGGQIFIQTHQSNQTINVFPYLENWFILAKPKTQFLQEWLHTFFQICSKTKDRIDAQNLQNSITVSPAILNPYFIVSDFSLQIVIQRKQAQLKKRNSTQYAVEYYNIWHLEAHESAFKMFLDYDQQKLGMWADQSVFSTQQLEMQSQVPFFRKFIGWHHHFFTNYLINYASYNCWGLDFLVEDGSQINKKLFDNAWNKQFMKQIAQINQNGVNQQFCRKIIEKEEKKYSYERWINLSLIIVFLLIAQTIWCINCVLGKSNKTKVSKSQGEASEALHQ